MAGARRTARIWMVERILAEGRRLCTAKDRNVRAGWTRNGVVGQGKGKNARRWKDEKTKRGKAGRRPLGWRLVFRVYSGRLELVVP